MIPALFPWLAAGAWIIALFFAALYHALAMTARVAVEAVALERSGESGQAAAGRLMDGAAALGRAAGLIAVAALSTMAVAVVRAVAYWRGVPDPEVLDLAVGLVISGVAGWVGAIACAMPMATHAGARLIWSSRTVLRATSALLWPFEPVGRFLDEVVRRLAGVEKKQVEEQAQEELLTVIEEGQALGAIDEEERNMIEAVVSFRDRTVQQIMTPRTDVEAMELTNDLGQVIKNVRALRHSRIPVYGESLDQIVGIFYVKDLMHWLGGEGARQGGGGGRPFDLKAILRPAYFVPETKTVRELLRELMEKKVHIALVADEYGGTAGLVTIEDIVEEIFGDIRDEHEAPTAETPDVVLRPEQGRADVDGAARIGDVNGALEPLGVQIPESEEYDTVAGFVVTTLGRIPRKGERFTHERMNFTILEAKPTKVVRVALEVVTIPAGSKQLEPGAPR